MGPSRSCLAAHSRLPDHRETPGSSRRDLATARLCVLRISPPVTQPFTPLHGSSRCLALASCAHSECGPGGSLCQRPERSRTQAENLAVRLTGCDTVTTVVDTPPPATLDDSDLAAAMDVAWALGAGEIRYHPKGAGSYHWVVETDGRPQYFITVDDLDTKPWIGVDRDSSFEGLEAAYNAARVLRHD